MTRRAGINEAPTVQLGIAGRQQQIPILETTENGEHLIGKTSVSELSQFLNPSAVSLVRNIQRFEIDAPTTGAVMTSRNQMVGEISTSTLLKFIRPTNNIISGSAETFGLVDGEILLPKAGGYKFTLQTFAKRTGEGAIIVSPEYDLDDLNLEYNPPQIDYTPSSLDITFPELEGDRDFGYNLSGGEADFQEGTLSVSSGGITLGGLGIIRSEPLDISYPLYLPSIFTIQQGETVRNLGYVQPVRLNNSPVFIPFVIAEGYHISEGMEIINFHADVFNAGNASSPSTPVEWVFTQRANTIPSTIVIEEI